jgi:putative transposase
LRARSRVSERRAGRVVGQPRSTQRRPPANRAADGPLERRVLELVRRHRRFGCRRVWALSRAEGWRVNRKRAYRLWRRLGLKVPRRQRRRRRLGSSANACHRRRAEHAGHVWCWDFIHDRTADGRPLKWLSGVDEYTRECLALEVRRGLPAAAVVAVLADVVRRRGAPRHARSDNGPEFIARATRAWRERERVGALYTAPAAPWENGYAEAFHSRLRDELLDAEEFGTPLEARVLAGQWRHEYNHERPPSAPGYRTPAAFAEVATVSVDPTLTATGT